MANEEVEQTPEQETPQAGPESQTPAADRDGTTAEGLDAVNRAEAEAEATEPEDPLAAARAEAAAMKDKLLRMAADFDNFRKRARREASDAQRAGRDGLLKDLLPVFDNLERAAQHAQTSRKDDEQPTDASFKGLADGIELVIRQFRDTLARLGIERVESVGKPFDPSVHEAIQHLETSDYPAGSVAAEVQAGYREADRLVRAALVVVAKPPSEPVTTNEESPADGDPQAG